MDLDETVEQINTHLKKFYSSLEDEDVRREVSEAKELEVLINDLVTSVQNTGEYPSESIDELLFSFFEENNSVLISNGVDNNKLASKLRTFKIPIA